MKTKTLIGALALAALVPSANAAVISLSTDTADPGAAFGSSFAGTLNDGFAYDEFDPTSTTPNLQLSGDGPNSDINDGYHGTGTIVTLRYTLTAGTYTFSAGEEIVMDLWGRETTAFNRTRDDDFDVTLYNGDYATTVAAVTNQAIDDTLHHRVTFSGLSDGDTFDRVEIVSRISNAEGSNNFVLMETRLASIPEPSSTALLGLAGMSLLLRRRK